MFKKVYSEEFLATKVTTQVTAAGHEPAVSKRLTVAAAFLIDSLVYKDFVFEESYESILGMPFLSGHLITFDFPNRKMYLKKRAGLDQPGNIKINVKWLGIGLRRAGGSISVSSIDPEGLADRKGIRRNDVLLKVYDQNVSSYGLVELVELLPQLRKGQGGVLTFTLKRGDDIMDVSFAKSDMALQKDEAN